MSNFIKQNSVYLNRTTKFAGIHARRVADVMGIRGVEGSSSPSGDFYSKTISQSCRFNDDDSPYMYRTFVDGNGKTYSLSWWMKRGCTDDYVTIMADADASYDLIRFNSDATMTVRIANNNCITDAVFRDISSWSHFLAVFDTTQSTASDRVKLWVNGVRQTFASASYPGQNTEAMTWNQNGEVNNLFAQHGGVHRPHGYVAEFIHVDGIACSPTDFGQFKNGVWVPIEYTGSYGTNGFHLDFSNAADLGEDQSGNGNDFTATNLASSDQMADSPTNNYATLSPIDKQSDVTLSEGNLGLVCTTAVTHQGAKATVQPDGKVYVEVTRTNATGYAWIGVVTNAFQMSNSTTNVHTANPGCLYYSFGQYYIDGVVDGSPTSWDSSGDVAQLALDPATGKVWFGNNGTWQGSGDPANGTNPVDIMPITNGLAIIIASYGNGTCEVNFGQDSANVSTAQSDENGYGSFEYAPPSGFLALCSANLSDPSWMADPTTDSPADAFDIVTRDGSGAAASVSSLNFSPDIVVIKNRDQADEWKCLDSVRGATKELNWDSTNAESTDANGLTSFDTNGYTLGTGADGYNDNAEAFVDYSWLESADYGIDIVSYTGTGAVQNVAHSLGVAPAMIIVKQLNINRTWYVYHVGANASPESGYVCLDLNNAFATNRVTWDDTAPTSAQFTLGTGVHVNASGGAYVAYLFANVPGFSKMGYYVANGSVDGPFVYCGFRPKFLIIKAAQRASSWNILDAERNPFNNDAMFRLYADDARAEVVNALVDILSNGFKINTNGASWNYGGGDRYIFMAFAEFPFKYANAR